ncbi:hypothetical protein [Spirillospora sp. CA-128828]|uniref:hypothetical protein n=1 Tax=Spirillospora sp. CA-128828 TaxID=3240033 RepID=UPI003D90D8AA
MNDVLTDLITRATSLENAAANNRGEVEQLQADAQKAAQVADEQERDARLTRSLIAIVNGGTALLTPGDITSDEEALTLKVGALRIGLPAGAPVADLRLLLGTLREISSQAHHLGVLCLDEIQRREGQATLTTATIPDEVTQQATGKEPASPPWESFQGETAVPPAELIGVRVAVHLKDGKTHTGVLTGAAPHVVSVRVDHILNHVPIRDFRTEEIARVERLHDPARDTGVHPVVQADPEEPRSAYPAEPATAPLPPLPRRGTDGTYSPPVPDSEKAALAEWAREGLEQLDRPADEQDGGDA